MKFYVCKKCGNLVTKIKDSGAPLTCCGEVMEELVPGAVEAAANKHIPEYTVEGNTVKVTVSEVEHPMAEVHYIEWIAIETKQGSQIKYLIPGEGKKAEATFILADGDEVVAAYENCNLHGLWQK